MKETLRVSVRALVEFTLHAEDIAPAGPDRERMQEGSRAHRARQGAAQEDQPGYEAEVALSLTVAGGEGFDLEVSGRADGLFEADGLLCVEEIKLWGAEEPLQEAVPAHAAQAACYAHMLCVSRGVPAIRMDIVYADIRGSVLQRFTQVQDAKALAARFDELRIPYARWQEALLRWRRTRDEALEAFPFPYSEFRAGQRTFSGNVFVAVRDRKRLLAQAPTGTGKTAATLFPALKALRAGYTKQIFYLTARTTGRALALSTLRHFLQNGARARALELTAKDKVCPLGALRRCDPEYCEMAKGFYIRLADAVQELLAIDMWDREAVAAVAGRHNICAFELSLSLAEIADVIVCDYNYAFDPVARIQRIFLQRNDMTLLVDEAHNLVDRARDMLSAQADSATLRQLRAQYGKQYGRKTTPYRALTRVLRRLKEIRGEAAEEGTVRLEAPPEGLAEDMQGLADALGEAMAKGQGAMLTDAFSDALSYVQCADRVDETYAILLERDGKEARVRLLCLDPAPYLNGLTAKVRGVVYFSATLTPLPQMRALLGGEEADGMLALPSPFPPEHMRVVRMPIDTRYAQRQRTAPQVARAIAALVQSRPGNYLALFPSYSYMRLVREHFEALEVPVQVICQESGMDESARDAFLARFEPGREVVGFCVMGGVFAEGIDLPGERLLGVAVVGVGLPQLCMERDVLRDYFNERRRDGFALAYRIPGMTKVLQSVGRVIRTHADKGTALLIDARFFDPEYEALLPAHFFPLYAAATVRALTGLLFDFWGPTNGILNGEKRE